MINDGGPAFPIPGVGPRDIHHPDGMSLRDWFAGQALAAVEWTEYTDGDITMRCYAIADAMLAEREK